jgi:hypothetical protein
MFVLRNLCRCKERGDKYTYYILSNFSLRVFMGIKRVCCYIVVVVVGGEGGDLTF